MAEREIALIVGAGSGLSASMARLGAREGMQVAVAARRPEGQLPGVRERLELESLAILAGRLAILHVRSTSCDAVHSPGH